jgi:very-short-patch-repair endonuclease
VKALRSKHTGKKDCLHCAVIRATFLLTLKARDLPAPVQEFRFAEGRRLRFDYAWPSAALAVEQEGLGGRHQFNSGFISDLKKYNLAALLGWTVLRFTTDEMRSGLAAEWVASFFKKRTP